MEKKQISKRLYVGGLSHTVSKAELQERFGKFGRVLDAEIITRKDDQGNPMKTFAYITVSISDADLKKCMSVLNKTKWKGGMLQIELAKESFLHRLAMEREEANLQKEKPQRNDKVCLLESLKKAGVVDFHMKAVPGTEVPEHKKWVVGKFGRVLPILHLRSQQKNKIVKYDPSKYCHNLRKLEPDLTRVVPISELTWHLEERDDSINKKRQGEFPVTEKPPKKMRQLGSEALNGAVVLSSGCQLHSKNTGSPQLDQRSKSKPNEKSELFPSRSLYSKISGRGLLANKSNVSGVSAQKNRHVSNSDIDSEEEMRAMVKKEVEIQKAGNVGTANDHLEIVGDNFELKHNSHWFLSNPDGMKKAIKGSYKNRESMECNNGYDSADTDEIIAESKTPDLSRRKTAILEDSKQGKVESKETLVNERHDLLNDFSLKMHSLKEYVERKGKRKKCKIAALQSTAANTTTKTSDSESSYSEPERGESESSSDYESMMQNCYRLDLTLDDLKALATENTGTPAEELDSTQGSSHCSVEENPKGDIVNKPKVPKSCPAVKKKSICPEDVVAAILAGEKDGDEESSKGQNNSCLKYQPFRGMGSLCEKELTEDSIGLKKRSVESLSLEARISYCGEESSKRQSKNHPLNLLEVGSKKRQNRHCEQSGAASLADEGDQPVSRPHLPGKKKDASSLQDDQNSEYGDSAAATAAQSEDESSDMDSNAAVSQKRAKQQLKSPKLCSKNLKRDVSNPNLQCEANKCENGMTSLLENKELCLHGTASKEPSIKKKRLQDNQRRLAALDERQKVRDLQKKLIQGALSNLDSQPAGKHKHIIFNSDVESEPEADEMLKKEDEPAPKTSGRLFESSEDEQDDTDDERFKIKPQFEGKAGEKLLKLQSRFGTDERFRMDARFLESESEEEAETNVLKTVEEEELAAEKRKNLQILGSLLNINLEHPKPTKTATSAKKFKDINALRYDPTREDHAVFERKPSATEKESKAKSKKREESEKLPEVSQEMYYDIAVDLKELFGSSKSKSEKNEDIPWDKNDAEDSTPLDHLGSNVESDVAQQSSGFTFSFFGDMEESGVKEEPYIVETIKPVKVTWQEDPRFQDSSSEGDDEPETSESERNKEMFFSLPQTGSARFFFFSKDDERLREGPKLFCRSADLSEDKDGWEDRRRLLLEECRKKHKDARRKVKAKK
ncbi:nucleolar protein 8 isoform X1 [Falco biarmicus]|uniref:nucleolar protein 8 isoform X1 n=2 Tax=Falco biarmicus TaxID=345155 RepID=UPI0024BD1202|nr:nucleolar protein 8 isoform X1 [Falco biarmicus]XP_056191701.1 nucleolar protein 8 isoform X1 [Falco biarmicus]XP_056191702.1 nucleolar protein 8 isoform X1 [Falco biarmicus]XP_056191703.1 nucleolar protein 8 isoform X1 [Falco biarmicus]